MAVHKLMNWEMEDEGFLLIAIHSSIEPYRMAYMINKHLGLGFSRMDRDQDIISPTYEAHYPVYAYFDKELNAPYYLVPNKYWGNLKQQGPAIGLFHDGDHQIKTVLIKEYQTVDYLLKIEREEAFFPLKKTLNSISGIPQVISAYAIDSYTIKQQDYLIFE
ncbi:IPExxxVDY family protein [Nonlabens xiamenensis]|uniref:IPExxxVDY family protein n=1 Tax=Nonlabens xiamenensis TaxID=2341043 RepID=UPI000F60FD86|nr:IPExxxVDY family protein [Nonlabens xiamenensis]